MQQLVFETFHNWKTRLRSCEAIWMCEINYCVSHIALPNFLTSQDFRTHENTATIDQT